MKKMAARTLLPVIVGLVTAIPSGTGLSHKAKITPAGSNGDRRDKSGDDAMGKCRRWWPSPDCPPHDGRSG
jgi:hypothetical protein